MYFKACFEWHKTSKWSQQRWFLCEMSRLIWFRCYFPLQNKKLNYGGICRGFRVFFSIFRGFSDHLLALTRQFILNFGLKTKSSKFYFSFLPVRPSNSKIFNFKFHGLFFRKILIRNNAVILIFTIIWLFGKEI